MTMTMNELDYVRSTVRQVPDFPKPGILFLDITTATKDAKSMNLMIEFLYEKFKDEKIDYIAGIESRGFIFGAPLACKLGAGFVPIRKPNKLPADTIKESYSLEYGTDTIEMHADAIKEGDRVLVIDDLLATGGTVSAACKLLTKAGADVKAAAFIIELADLQGRKNLPQDVEVVSMITY